MKFKKKKDKLNDYPSLYDAFELGDRVVRKLRDKNGRKKVYRGIVLAIDDKSKNIEIYWDSLEGNYKPNEADLTFTNCDMIEIFKGNKVYSPIKKDPNYI